MSVTQCRDCSGKVSFRAKTCPHCGAPLSRKFFKLICLLTVIALGAGGYVYWKKLGPEQKEEIQKKAKDFTEDTEETLKEGFKGAKEKAKQGFQGAKKKVHDLTED